jgi:biofilm PGA synthesis protein PgaD
MDKSRPGNPKPAQGLIIESPGLLRTRQRIAEVGVTLVFWAVLLYLWHPLASLLAWLFQDVVTYQYLISEAQVEEMLRVISIYFFSLLVLLVLYISWAKWNQYRFRGKEQRSGRPPVDVDAVAEHYNVDVAALPRWRRIRQMVVDLDSDGKLTDVQCGPLSGYRRPEG